MDETFATFMQDRAQVYKFLTAMLKDEISKDLLVRMTGVDFLSLLQKMSGKCFSPELRPGGDRLVSFMKNVNPDRDFNELRYEYADLFLNAGVTPVFMYESVYVSGDPLVNQQPVFEVREFYRRGNVHVSEDYPELDDHIAIEFEFVRHLSEGIARSGEDYIDLMLDFETNHFKWLKEFCECLIRFSQSDFYKALAEIITGLVSIEKMVADNIRNKELPPRSFADAIALFAEAVDVLDLGDEYYTLKEGAKEKQPTRKINTHCYLCGALCGITATVEDGILTKIQGLRGDPKGGGAVCPKGASNPYHVHSAYRLKTPLIRENGRFRKATWDEALGKVARKFAEMEPSTVGYFRGNDFNNWLHEAVFKAYGAISTTHRPMCDNSIRMQLEHNLNDKRPWIDYRESDYIIHWGINDSITAYGRKMPSLLRDTVKRGAKLVVFDTRRSENAELATEWIAPKPATDGAVAMAMCYVIVQEGLYNKEFVEKWTHGFEDFRKRLLGEEDGIARTPQWAEGISEVPAITIERIAREFAAADHPATICWGGVAQTPNGFFATAAIHALNGLMGTFDAPGGPSLPYKRKLKSPWGDHAKPEAKKTPKPHNLGMWDGWVPSFFPKDVAEGRFKALFCYWGSPTLSWGNMNANVEAINALDFVVTMDAFMNNIATLSDVVIPGVSALEMDSLRADWLYDAFISSFQRAIDPLYNCKPEWWVFIQLAKRLGLGGYFPWDDIEEPLRNMLDGTPWDYDELKEKGFIITDQSEYYKYKKWGGFNPPEGYGSSGKTQTGKYNFKNPVAEKRGVDPLPDYKAPKEEYPEIVPDSQYPLSFNNFRTFQHEHSSTLSNPYLMKLRGSNPLWINVMDAKTYGIADGDKVVLESPWGRAEMRALVTWDIKRGVAASPGGFGHWRGLEADPRYPQYGGVNCGGLVPPNYPDKVSGTPLLKYFKVRVSKAE